jgi:hypothetical protein
MPPTDSAPVSMTWLPFVLLTMITWGVYGIFLHKGQMAIANPGDPNARYKAFLFVGIAYFIVAIVGPAVLLLMRGASWSFPSYGLWMSLVAGIVGALGAFGVLLAFGNGGSPVLVMTIIFAGAPIVNALVVIFLIDKNADQINWQFMLGIVLAAVGGAMATYFKPASKPHGPPAPAAQVQPAEPHAMIDAVDAVDAVDPVEPTQKS